MNPEIFQVDFLPDSKIYFIFIDKKMSFAYFGLDVIQTYYLLKWFVFMQTKKNIFQLLIPLVNIITLQKVCRRRSSKTSES